MHHTASAPIAAMLAAYRPRTAAEAADVARVAEILAAGDPWSRDLPLHVTASALIVHPATRRVLLRWHERMRAWLQVGGHGRFDDESRDHPEHETVTREENLRDDDSLAAARAGHPVRVADARAGAADEALRGLRKRLERDVERGRLAADEATA